MGAPLHKMRILHAAKTLKILDGVKIVLKGRLVHVEGPRGKLTRNFNHIQILLKLVKKKTHIHAEMWDVRRTNLACLRTVMTHINNMMIGVTRGFRYHMRLVYAHFPIDVNIDEDGKGCAIRNFLGEKVVRRVRLLEGVTMTKGSLKDELLLEANDIEAVSCSAAQIHQRVLVRHKDIRKFLDGIYVSKKGPIPEEE